MKKLFHSHFWIFTSFFLLSSSYLLAHSISNLIRLKLVPVQATFIVKSKAVTKETGYQRNVRAHYAILNQKNLFDEKQKAITPPPPPPRETKKKKVVKKQKACDPNASYKRSRLPLQLKGTSVASDPAFSVAVIYDAKARKEIAVRPGDEYNGIKICDVEAGPLVVKKVKKKYYVTDKKGKPLAMTRIVEEVVKKPSYVKIDRGGGRFEYLEQGAPAGRGGNYSRYNRKLYKQYRRLRNTKLNLSSIRKKGNQQYSLSRNLLNSVTNRLDVLASQAAIVPFFKKGRPAGFRVYHIRKGSLYQKLGMKNGDVIRRINGYEFTSPQKALEAYSNLLSAKNLSVEILRKGKLKNYSYEVKNQ